MAGRAQQVTGVPLAGAIALGLVLAAVGLGLVPLLWLGVVQGFSRFDAYLPRVIWFTLEQALLSTLLSVGLALPVARALARRRFAGSNWILKVFALPLALPAIVAILGIVGVYGNSGLLGGLVPVYGLSGILLAHVFFNLPLAVRLMVARLDAVPAENFRLAAQLGFSDAAVWRHVEWPQLAPALSGIASLIFLLCMASFAVVLILGGGPGATTLEVAIYQSLRLDFDPARAAVLALAQVAICAVLVLAAGRLMREARGEPGFSRRVVRYDGTSVAAKVMDGVAIGLAMLLVLPPLVQVVVAGLTHVALSAPLLQALVTSLAIGVSAGAISLALAWVLASVGARAGAGVVQQACLLTALASLVMPPAVIATGWFITLVPVLDLNRFAVVLVILLNALMALPFAWSPLFPAIVESYQKHDRLCSSLGLSGWARLRLIELPVLRRPLALAYVMAVIVSLGDLSAISLFGSDHLVTLPALIYRQMGHYRMAEASGTALVLMVFCFTLIWGAQRWSRTP
jgi:thiamine transport system permease protein